MNIAVFLDRDGTINEEMGYINHITRFRLLPRAPEAIKMLNDAGLKVVVISNQSGAARGYFPEKLISEVNDRMIDLLQRQGASIDGIYYCPHHRDAVVSAYKVDCDCRKPKISLISRSARDLDIDVSRSYVIGDRLLDTKLAENAGAKGVLVLTGYGRGELEYLIDSSEVKPDFIAEDLYEAACWIVKEVRSKK